MSIFLTSNSHCYCNLIPFAPYKYAFLSVFAILVEIERLLII